MTLTEPKRGAQMAQTVKPVKPAGRASPPGVCGTVHLEIDFPARWAFHDQSAASRRAHGAAYATYVGSWRKRFRITEGEGLISRYEDANTRTVRSFCSACGSATVFERAGAPHRVNTPRALFASPPGREPLYHIAIEQA